eukprot:SAG31_NODE_13855_length_842_cov_1.044415_1_plen_71_part_00
MSKRAYRPSKRAATASGEWTCKPSTSWLPSCWCAQVPRVVDADINSEVALLATDGPCVAMSGTTMEVCAK